MVKNARIQFRIDADTKKRVETQLKPYKIKLSDLLRVYMNDVAEHGLPGLDQYLKDHDHSERD